MKQNLNILRFNSSKADRHTSRPYSLGQIQPIMAYSRHLPPFQVDVPHLDNSQIESFVLKNCQTGEEFDETDSLTLQKSGYTESYPNSGLTIQDSGSTSSAWSFSMGAPEVVSKLQFMVICEDANTLPSKFQVRILDAKGGTQLLESEEHFVNLQTNVNELISIDFGAKYENGSSLDLYLEIKSDGTWSPVGNSGAYSGETTARREYVEGVVDYPNNDNAIDVSAYVKSFDYLGNFDKIVYFGDELQNYIPNGTYEAILQVNGNTFYSDYFSVQRVIENPIVIEYWHDKPLYFETGMFRFAEDYTNKVYLNSLVLEPEYRKNKKVEQLADKDVVIRVTSWKQNKFKFVASEYMLDALNGIDHHHHIRISYNNETFIINDIQFNVEEWDDLRHFAMVTCEFKTNYYVTSLGKGSGDTGYQEEEIQDLDFSEFPKIEQPTLQFDYYVAAETIDVASYTASFPHYFIGQLAGNRRLYYYEEDGTKKLISQEVGGVVYVEPSDGFDYFDGTLLTRVANFTITDNGSDNYTISGATWKYATLYVDVELTDLTVVTTELDGISLLNGYSFDQPDLNRVMIRFRGKNVNLGDSIWKTP